MNNFQTVLVVIFLAFFVIGVLVFSGTIKVNRLFEKDTAPVGKVVLWGTFPSIEMGKIATAVSTNTLTLSYVKKNPETYQQDLVEAFANGNGPDIFIITPDMIKANSNFIYKIPYESYPQKAFIDYFIPGADIYMDNEGIVGFPLVTDPMVLYYNKDIIYNEGIVNPPQTWDELFTMNSSLTKRENDGKINQSMIALGQYTNINNVKDILVTLLLQNNNPIVTLGAADIYVATLTSSFSGATASSVFEFFFNFSNPSNNAYSWNRSLPNSLDMFVGGKLAFYIGKASELFKIQSMNPNLSFDVAQIPQIKDTSSKRTYGDIYAVVVSKKSKNINSSFGVAQLLSQGESASDLSAVLSLPPTSKSLLSKKPPTDKYLYSFFNSSLITKSWLDPNKKQTDLIFKELSENILSNNFSISSSITKANGQLDLLLKK